MTVLSVFQFTHPGRGATRYPGAKLLTCAVSIHAPREGCDDISEVVTTALTEFQFTHPGRGATISARFLSIRAKFQFTHPGRGATDKKCSICTLIHVSIHAPREGCDSSGDNLRNVNLCFNSRTPGGVRRYSKLSDDRVKKFQFTHPGRGATDTFERQDSKDGRFNSRTPGGVRRISTFYPRSLTSVSIHAPREGCDRGFCIFLLRVISFNSRTPGGVRLVDTLSSRTIE